MSYADNLPEDAKTLRQTSKALANICLCHWDWIADTDDLETAKECHRYPRIYPLVTYVPECPVLDHASKVGTRSHWNHWIDKYWSEPIPKEGL